MGLNRGHHFHFYHCFCRYTYDQRYDRALEIYLRLRHKDVYQLIHKHNLFPSIEDKIVLLMDFDKEVNFKIKDVFNCPAVLSFLCFCFVFLVLSLRKLLTCSSTMKTRYR